MKTPRNLLQLFDPVSSTYTYILWDESTREAIIIDAVDEQITRDLALLQQHDLRLRYIVETHAHADHITSAAALIEHTGATAATPAGCGIKPAAIQLEDGNTLVFGSQSLKALHTPGHTAGSMSFLWQNGDAQNVFTGDTLLIGGCGRTDFQSGCAKALYNSLTQVLFKLAPETTIWPGHDYKGQTSSTVAHEMQHNARITQDGRLRTEAEFIAVMDGLHLPAPKRINEAVQANLSLGVRHDAGGAKANELQTQAPQQAGYAGDVSPQLAYQWWQNGEAVLIDIRTHAERSWVGFIPNVAGIEFKIWPGMAINPEYETQLRVAMQGKPLSSKVMLLCRSGIRSIPAAQKAQALGFEAYNILEGFEGDPDAQAHRNTVGGWRARGLPWAQN